MNNDRVSFKEINRLAIPAIFAGIAEPIIGLVDTGVIGNLGENSEISQAAVGLGATFYSLLLWSLSQIRTSISSLVSRYIGANKLKDIAFDDAFLCGPEAMIHVAIDVLIENNVDKNSIYFELFSTPISSEEKATQNFEGTSEITVVVDDEETTFNMDAKTTILSAALKEGLDAPYSCQGGICSSCLAKVTEGTAKMEKNAILSDSEIAEGLILTCQAHPTSQKITIDYDDV